MRRLDRTFRSAKLEFSIDDAGLIVARPRHANSIYGILGDFAPDIPITVDAVKEAVRRRAADTVSGRH